MPKKSSKTPVKGIIPPQTPRQQLKKIAGRIQNKGKSPKEISLDKYRRSLNRLSKSKYTKAAARAARATPAGQIATSAKKFVETIVEEMKKRRKEESSKKIPEYKVPKVESPLYKGKKPPKKL